MVDSKMDLSKLTNEQLVVLAQNSNEEAKELVILRNKNLVKSIAHSFFLVGGDEEDLLIEGMLGVSKAIDGFNKNNLAECKDFSSYAGKCIRNQIILAIRKATSKKNAPLNYYISLTGINDETADKSFLVIDKVSDPVDEVIDRENVEELKTKINLALSKFENEVLTMFLEGYSYKEICERLGKNEKSVENAIQRIRNKVRFLI